MVKSLNQVQRLLPFPVHLAAPVQRSAANVEARRGGLPPTISQLAASALLI